MRTPAPLALAALLACAPHALAGSIASPRGPAIRRRPMSPGMALRVQSFLSSAPGAALLRYKPALRAALSLSPADPVHLQALGPLAAQLPAEFTDRQFTSAYGAAAVEAAREIETRAEQVVAHAEAGKLEPAELEAQLAALSPYALYGPRAARALGAANAAASRLRARRAADETARVLLLGLREPRAVPASGAVRASAGGGGSVSRLRPSDPEPSAPAVSEPAPWREPVPVSERPRPRPLAALGVLAGAKAGALAAFGSAYVLGAGAWSRALSGELDLAGLAGALLFLGGAWVLTRTPRVQALALADALRSGRRTDAREHVWAYLLIGAGAGGAAGLAAALAYGAAAGVLWGTLLGAIYAARLLGARSAAAWTVGGTLLVAGAALALNPPIDGARMLGDALVAVGAGSIAGWLLSTLYTAATARRRREAR